MPADSSSAGHKATWGPRIVSPPRPARGRDPRQGRQEGSAEAPPLPLGRPSPGPATAARRGLRGGNTKERAWRGQPQRGSAPRRDGCSSTISFRQAAAAGVRRAAGRPGAGRNLQPPTRTASALTGQSPAPGSAARASWLAATPAPSHLPHLEFPCGALAGLETSGVETLEAEEPAIYETLSTFPPPTGSSQRPNNLGHAGALETCFTLCKGLPPKGPS